MKIKKILCGLIIGFGLLSFSNAGYLRDYGSFGYSPFDNQYDVAVFSDGNVKTQKAGIEKNIFVARSYLNGDGTYENSFWFWDNNSIPYFVINSNWYLNPDPSSQPSYQGEITKYWICDELLTENGATNCVVSDYVLHETGEVFKNFFSSLSSSDQYYFDSLDSSWYVGNWIIMCFSSSSLGKSLCFNGGVAQGYDEPGQFLPIDNLNTLAWFDTRTIHFDSPELNNYIGQSPGSSGGGNTNTQTNQLTCPTIKQLINNFEPQYNTGLCYSSNLIYSGGQFQQVTPKTIFELYPQYQDFVNDINTYYNYCKPPSTQETCGNAFTGKTEEWTLISKLPDNVTPVNVYNYCNYTLNLDPNQTICTTSTGSLNPGGITVEDNIDNINKLPITVITPGTPPQEEGNGTGSVFDKYTKQEDETKRRDIIGKAENTIETMKEIYTKLSGIFRAREGKNGIIPPLITGLIALILLFKLWKK